MINTYITDLIKLYLWHSEIIYYKKKRNYYYFINSKPLKEVAKILNISERRLLYIINKFGKKQDWKVFFIPKFWFYWREKLWGLRKYIKIQIIYPKDILTFSKQYHFCKRFKINAKYFWDLLKKRYLEKLQKKLSLIKTVRKKEIEIKPLHLLIYLSRDNITYVVDFETSEIYYSKENLIDST